MAKRRKSGSPPLPGDDRRHQIFGEEPTPPREDLRIEVERRIAAYDSVKGTIDLRSLGIQSYEANWVMWKLASLPGLSGLEISGNAVGDAGAAAVAERLTGLTWLDICGSTVGDAGAAAIADRLTRLDELDISINAIGDTGAAAIAKGLTRLTELDISLNDVGDAGAAAIAERLTRLSALNISGNNIGEAGTVVSLVERLAPEWNPDGQLAELYASNNPLMWPGMTEPISGELLEETDPRKLRDLLLSLRDASTDLSAAGVAFIGRTGHGKTHAARWTVAMKGEYESLRRPIPKDERTWGYDRYAATWGKAEHAGDETGDLYLTVVDVGGHREQLNSASNLVYMNARRSVFVLVVKASESFREGNWGRYYLRLIESLRARKRFFEDGRRRSVYELAEGGDVEKIPVLILVTHTKGENRVNLPTADQLRQDHPLLDVVSMEEWEAPEGDQYLPALYQKLGGQLGKLQSLRGATLAFIKALMDKVRDVFQLDEPAARDVPPRTGSLSVTEFRALCAELGGKTAAEQEAAIRELSSFGYLAFAGNTARLYEESRLLNPRFVNHYLFEKILRDDRTRANNGYMQSDWLDGILSGVEPGAEREELLKLIKDCLVTFEWTSQGWPEGMFVPDLLPARKTEDHPDWPDAQCAVTLKPIGFFSEDGFFRFIARQREHLRVAHTQIRPDGTRRDVLLFRNECVLGGARHRDDDRCTALVTADVIGEVARVQVRGPDYAAAKSFGDGLVAQLKAHAGCDFGPEWEFGAFENLFAQLAGENETATRARAILRWMATRLSDVQLRHTFSGARMGGWAIHNSDDTKYHADQSCWDGIRRSVVFFEDKKVLAKHGNGGFILTRDVGGPFVEWMKAVGKLPPSQEDLRRSR